MQEQDQTQWRRRGSSGFTLVELMFVVAIVLIVSVVALLQVQGSLKSAKSDTALQTVLGQMRLMHEMAIDQRKIYRMSFISPGTLQLDRMDIGAGGALTAVLQGTVTLPPETQFTLVTGMPNSAATVPDGMGSAGNAIDFSVDNGGGQTQVYFRPDGRALDSANRTNNGVVYVARPGELYSLRAVTLWGATGRTKGWRLAKQGSTAVWEQ